MRRVTLLLAAFTLSWIALGPQPGFGDEKDKSAEIGTKPRGNFTISKETTHITGPVDKDGYVDYSAALNERLGKGVTADNNANVLIWKALGPRPSRVKMPPEFFKWMGIQEPPEKGDYFLDSYAYMKKHMEIDPERKFQDLQNEWDQAMGVPWTTKKYPYIAGWLIANEKPLDLIVAGSKRPRYFSPLTPVKVKGELGGLTDVGLPAAQKCRHLIAALGTRAMLHLGEGRPKEAWQDLLAAHRLARLLGSGGTLIESLVAYALDAIASHHDLTFLERAKLDAKGLKKCLRDLQELPPLPVIADKVDLAERFMFLDVVMTADRRGLEYLANHVAIRVPPKGDPSAKGIFDGIDWDPALRNGNEWYDRLVAALRLKDRAARQKQLERIAAELEALKAKVSKMDLAEEPAKNRGKVVGDILAAWLIPPMGKLQQASDRLEQTQRNLHVAFALAIHKAEEGRYPKSLDALAPKYLAKVPSDLFSGKALIYRPVEKGYLFYSVGVNGRDDGGRNYEDDPPGDDLRVRVPLAR